MVTTVGIAGITGKFSRLIARHLLSSADVHVRGYCRDPSKLPNWLTSSDRFDAVHGEADDGAAIRKFTKGLDVAVCGYLGSNDLMVNGQKRLIDACEAEGVARYIASDYTLDYRKLNYGELPAKDPMKEVAQYLKEKKVQGVHVLIGVFMETFWSFLGLFDDKNLKISYWGNPDDSWESTSYNTAAEYVASVALDDHADGFLEFVGDRKNLTQIAESFQGVYGKRLELERQGSLDDLEELMQKRRRAAPANIPAWLPLYFQRYAPQTHLKQTPDNERYPHVKPVTFEDFMKLHPLEKLAKAQWTVGS